MHIDNFIIFVKYYGTS